MSLFSDINKIFCKVMVEKRSTGSWSLMYVLGQNCLEEVNALIRALEPGCRVTLYMQNHLHTGWDYHS